MLGRRSMRARRMSGEYGIDMRVLSAERVSASRIAIGKLRVRSWVVIAKRLQQRR